MLQLNQINLKQSYADYAKSFDRPLKTVYPDYDTPVQRAIGFIEWTDEPTCWAGAWKDITTNKSYVLCCIRDFSYVGDLKTLEQAKLSAKVYREYSIYNFPHSAIESLGDLRCMVGDQVCKRTTVTHQERLKILNSMSPLELEQYEKQMAIKASQLTDDFLRQDATVEYPVRIHLTGTDDTSYSTTVESYDMAIAYVKMLEDEPTWDNLKELGFVFTN